MANKDYLVMKLCVVLLTYAHAVTSARAHYADITVRALVKHLRFDGDVHVHIADDGSYEGHVRHLTELMAPRGWSVSSTNAKRGGYGKSYNLATQKAHDAGEYFLMLEDDWELTGEFKVNPIVDGIADSTLGCIRLGYLGRTDELRGKLIFAAQQTFLEFDPESPEFHVWTGHPRVESLEFQKALGPWPEGMPAGATESAVAARKQARHGVAWPMDIGIRAGQLHGTLFAHIGDTQAADDALAI